MECANKTRVFTCENWKLLCWHVAGRECELEMNQKKKIWDRLVVLNLSLHVTIIVFARHIKRVVSQNEIKLAVHLRLEKGESP